MIEWELEDPALRRTGQDRWADSPAASRRLPGTCGVLVVDDEACVRGVLGVAMQQQGFAVWVAASGQEAIDLFRRHGEIIDVVLLDVRMPELDGLQTLAALRELNPQVRCCFMSGDLGNHTEERLHGLGVATVLAKPFELGAVTQVVRELVSNGDESPKLESAWSPKRAERR